MRAIPMRWAAVVATAVVAFPLACGEDTCRIELSAPEEGDPVELSLCGTCNRGKDPQGGLAVDVEFVANAADVGCRCAGASCVFCEGECRDETPCRLESLITDEATGCVEPAVSLELEESAFPEGFRLPITVNASSRIGEASTVIFLVRPTPTPTATPTPTPTPLLGL
jgi:hypothetical protein